MGWEMEGVLDGEDVKRLQLGATRQTWYTISTEVPPLKTRNKGLVACSRFAFDWQGIAEWRLKLDRKSAAQQLFWRQVKDWQRILDCHFSTDNCRWLVSKRYRRVWSTVKSHQHFVPVLVYDKHKAREITGWCATIPHSNYCGTN